LGGRAFTALRQSQLALSTLCGLVAFTLSCFFSPTDATLTHAVEEQNNHTTGNLSGNSGCVVKCVIVNMIIRDGDMGNLPSVPTLVTTNYAGTDKLRQRRMTQPIAK